MHDKINMKERALYFLTARIPVLIDRIHMAYPTVGEDDEVHRLAAEALRRELQEELDAFIWLRDRVRNT